MPTETHKGKTAKEWCELHEVMRRDFARVVKEKEKLTAHVAASIDKDNDWGPEQWEAWNTKAAKLSGMQLKT